MEKEKYFIPEIEDICIGYSCVEETVIGWEDVVVEDECSDFDPCRAVSFLRQGKLKTSYLTKEQIENESWKFTEQINNKLYFKKGAFVLTFEDDYINIDNLKGQDIGYWGKCKDINTFRYICKLLEI